MHWYYKDVGDAASAQAASLKNWVEQVKHWQDELARPAHADRTVAAVTREMLKERIFVYTPAGDVKDVPAGATPLDFAYLIHSDVGNHVSGVRVSSTDGSGRMVRRLVPLDYELRNGDVVEILTRKDDPHPATGSRSRARSPRATRSTATSKITSATSTARSATTGSIASCGSWACAKATTTSPTMTSNGWWRSSPSRISPPCSSPSAPRSCASPPW